MVLESVRAGPVAAAKPDTSCRVRVCGAEVVQVRGEDAQRPDADPLLHEDEDGHNPHFLSVDLLHPILESLEPMREKLGPVMRRRGGIHFVRSPISFDNVH